MAPPAKARSRLVHGVQAQASRPAEAPRGWAQASVEAGLATRADGQTRLLAEAHQQSVDLTPKLPVKVRGQLGREAEGSPASPHPAAPGQPGLQRCTGLLRGLGRRLGPPESVGDSVHVRVHRCGRQHRLITGRAGQTQARSPSLPRSKPWVAMEGRAAARAKGLGTPGRGAGSCASSPRRWVWLPGRSPSPHLAPHGQGQSREDGQASCSCPLPGLQPQLVLASHPRARPGHRLTRAPFSPTAVSLPPPALPETT